MSVALLVVGLVLRLASPETIGDFNLHVTGTILIWVGAILLAFQALAFLAALLWR